MKKTIIAIALLIAAGAFAFGPSASADKHGQIAGKFFLQTEANGELWYIFPENGQRYWIENPSAAFNLIRFNGLGISNADLEKIPAANSADSRSYDHQLTKRLAGKFLLQTESKGEAWYVNPDDMKRYFLGRPDEAFRLFASIARGISNEAALGIKEAKSIVGVALEAGSFSTLIAAAQAAGLAETLDQAGPFTVFAPTDEAFAKLPAGTVEALLEDIPALTNILLYHVLPGKVPAAKVVNLSEAKTLQGSSVKIILDQGVMIDNAKVVASDVMAVNGVIHVIDQVILP